MNAVHLNFHTRPFDVLDWLVAAMKTPQDHSVAQSTAASQIVDAEIIRQSQNSDENAFRQLVECYQQTIHLQMTRFSPDLSVRETLTHDVFVEAYLSLSSFRFKSPFEHWLRKIAVRVGYRHWKDQARDKRRKESLQQYAMAEATEASVESCAEREGEASDQLHAVLSQLAPRDRLVLTLLYWDDCSVEEAARRAGWSKTMLKVQAHRARKRLKRLLEANDE